MPSIKGARIGRRIPALLRVIATLPLPSAGAETAALTWDNICRATVCRATGHGGVMDARISPDGETVAYFSNRADRWSDDLWVGCSHARATAVRPRRAPRSICAATP